SLGRRGIPLGGRAEARVDVRLSFGHETNLQRASHRLQLVCAEPLEIGCEFTAGMTAASDYAQRIRRYPCNANAPRVLVTVAAPRTDSRSAEVRALQHGSEDGTEHRCVRLDEGDVDREFAVSLDELLCSVQWIDEPVTIPGETVRDFRFR